MAERLISPSKVSAWLACPHTLTLDHRKNTGDLVVEHVGFGEMARMLLDKGQAHEAAVLARYEADGRSIFRVPERRTLDSGRWESFDDWVSRVGNPMADGHDVIVQMPFVHDGMRGVADFLVRVDDPSTPDGVADDGRHVYEAVDAKLARADAKPGHVLQLCFYADALHALTGACGENVHIALGSGSTETIRLAEVHPYWRRLRGRLEQALDAAPTARTVAEPCPHCQFCEFEGICDAEWRDQDSLSFVANLRTKDRLTLADAGVATMEALATLDPATADVDVSNLDVHVRQARLQVGSRTDPDGSPPRFEAIERQPSSLGDPDDVESPDPADGLVGFAALPAPDEGDVFLDFEGHPFWRPDAGLFFLFGLIQRREAGHDWEFVEFWAHDLDEERTATGALIDHLAARRQQFPNMHVYHYNHTERSALHRLTIEHAIAELRLEELIADGFFVDLYPIVKGAVCIGTESYGLKHVELLSGYERGHDIDKGAGAVVEYEHWMTEPDPDVQARMLDRIARYNEDDVRATRAVRDWLVEQRPVDTVWRPAVLGRIEPDEELDARIDALHSFGRDTPEHLMGDLLGYWRRERRAVAADVYRLAIADESDRFESRSAITGLSFVGLEDRFSETTGKKLKWPVAVFTFPAQPIDSAIEVSDTMIVALNEQEWVFFKIAGLDIEAGELRLDWNGDRQEAGIIPTTLVHHKWFHEAAKLDALQTLADALLDGSSGGSVKASGHAMLRRDTPGFVDGAGPSGGRFVADIGDVCNWATHLEHGVVPVQGPPGTGKTFTGAHVIRALVAEGKRVGITAMSHLAIDNLMHAVVERFTEHGELDRLRAVRKAVSGRVRSVDYVNDNAACADGDYNVIAGTPWLFASNAMRNAPVDVLIVDEAGQLGLADTMAASISASSVILLGDPQQLAQVSRASHPNGAGASALEHALGGHPTVSADRGLFLDTTWRMHSHVSDFISDVMYEGRLRVHASCDVQTTEAAGTGVRWLRVDHTGCSTSSEVEARAIGDRIRMLLNTPWTNQRGEVDVLRPKDVIVVAPYNDQVRLIREVFSGHKRLAKVDVGTVDRFQGREAAVVFYSMTSSSAVDMPRGSDFLFSRNRLNVAISRARCLAHLVCTEELLDSRASTVEDMRRIGALCSFVERAQSQRSE